MYVYSDLPIQKKSKKLNSHLYPTFFNYHFSLLLLLLQQFSTHAARVIGL